MAWRIDAGARAITAMALCLIGSSQVWGQEQPVGSRPADDRPAIDRPPVEAPPILLGPAPVSVYPLELLGLLGPKRGGVTLTPALFVSEEWNDNINGDNLNREWDFITNVGPALSLVINRPTSQLSVGYSSSSQIYARDPDFTEIFGTHNFVLTGYYQPTANWTLSASDSFTYQRSGVVVAGFSTGRAESAYNNLNLVTTWRMTQADTLTVNGNYALQRFPGENVATDSDTYTFQGAYGRDLTPRFTGNINYSFEYLDLHGLQDSRTHTPTVGFSYTLTPTLTFAIQGGAAFTQVGNENVVGPSGLVRLTKVFQFGLANVQYTRDVDVAGGFGGPTDLQTYSATLLVNTLARGLIFLLSPEYNISESLSSRQSEQVDVQSFTMTAAVAYQLSLYATVFAGYSFFRQRTGASSTRQANLDQSIVRVGLQIRYPFHLD